MLFHLLFTTALSGRYYRDSSSASKENGSSKELGELPKITSTLSGGTRTQPRLFGSQWSGLCAVLSWHSCQRSSNFKHWDACCPGGSERRMSASLSRSLSISQQRTGFLASAFSHLDSCPRVATASFCHSGSGTPETQDPNVMALIAESILNGFGQRFSPTVNHPSSPVSQTI